MIVYWECSTHKCGSCNFNNLSRHEMPWCHIEKKEGNPKNKTWHEEKHGGLNGDISRKFYKDWEFHCLEKQKQGQRKENWTRQVLAHEDFIEDVQQKIKRRSYFDKRR